MPVDVRFLAHPFAAEVQARQLPDGLTVAGIVKAVAVGEADVVLVRGAHQWPVKRRLFARVRPAPGTTVLVRPRVGATAIVPALATWIGSTFAVSATTATIIAGVAVSAAVILATTMLFGIADSDPAKRAQDRMNPTLRGLQNVMGVAGQPLPMVLGRHQMAGVKVATGYTEMVGQKAYRHERMTFGVGPVALDDLRIGLTSIAKFRNVKLQFRNIDQARTLAAIPALADMDVDWLDDGDRMTLYSRDIFEDADGAKLDYNVEVIRTTRENTMRANVQFYFAGLVKITKTNKKQVRTRKIGVYYRPAAGGAWVTVSERSYKGKTTAILRFGVSIDFPSAGEWDVKIVRLSKDDDDEKVRDDSYLEAIQSFAPGNLPSPAGVAEIALRIKATDQISGALDPVNAVVRQMAPVWTGSAWTAAQPIRHPADIAVHLLRGAFRKRPVADAGIDLAGFLAWKTAYPDWCCDMVLTQDMRLGDLVQQVLACGIAVPAIFEGKHSLLTDQSAAPPVQVFTPRNTANWRASWRAAPKVHGLRVVFTAEHAGWQDDEVICYGNGYSAANATEIETVAPPGLTVQDGDGIRNVARWAYFQLAQLTTRTTTASFEAELDHIVCRRGDPVIFQTDALRNSLGTARIIAVTRSGGDLVSLALDDATTLDEGASAAIAARASSGAIQYVTATLTSGVWLVTPGSGTRPDGAAFDPDAFAAGDLVTLFEVGGEPVKWLVKSIAPDFAERATVELTEATEIPLGGLNRELPEYDPRVFDAAEPISLRYSIEYDDQEMSVVLRWSVIDRSTQPEFRVIVEDADENPVATILTGDTFARFAVQSVYAEELTARVAARQPTGLWGEPATLAISTAAQFDAPDAVERFESRVVGDTIHLAWSVGAENVDYYEIRYAQEVSGATWGTAVPIVPTARGESANVPARDGTYLIKAVTFQGLQSTTATITIVRSVGSPLNAVETLALAPGWSSAAALSGGLAVIDGTLVFASDGDLLEAEDLLDIADLLTWGRSALSASFTSDEVIDLGAVDTARVGAAISARGYYPSFDLLAVEDLLAVPDLLGGADGEWAVEMQISTTDDDPGGAATWSDWATLIVGDYRARAFRFRLGLSVVDPQVLVEVTAANVRVDMTDRIEAAADVACGTSGQSVSFSPPFRALKSLVINPQSVPAGSRAVVTGKSAAGFTLTLYDSAGSPVAGSFDYTAVGYGREGV